MTNIQQGTSNIVIGYDDADRRTSVTYPNTISIIYAYNIASELTSLTYKKGATTLGDLTYTYDLAGNRIKTGRRVRCESIKADSVCGVSADFVTK